MAGERLVLSTVLLQHCRIESEEELVQARLAVKVHAVDLAFSAVNQTKLVTVASELGRNVLEHGMGGQMQIDRIDGAARSGIRLTFLDHGPGIEDVKLAMTDGYSSKQGLGLGLSGSKRLMDEFEIRSEPGMGTTVIVTKWK
ncbi:MAG TPA: anti-sigma regulatory factor [Oculatellaceae cyanobacterium]